MLPIMAPGVLTGEIPIWTNFTFYTLYGWVFPWLAMAVGVVVIAWVLVREERTDRLKRNQI